MKFNLPKIQNKKALFLALAVTFVVIGLICVLYNLIGNKVPYQDGIWLDSGWNVSVKGQDYQNVTLSEFSFDAVDAGDVVTMETVLPELKMAEPVLRFLSHYSAATISIDGKELYQYGKRAATSGTMVGCGFHYVMLPNDAAGSILEVKLELTESNAFTSIDRVLIETNGKVITDFVYANRMTLCISIFLIVFGCILVLIAVFAQVYHPEFRWLLWISLFSVTIGVWISCNYHLIQLFSQDFAMNSMLEYIALYLAPVPIMIFFFEISSEMRFKRMVFCILSACSGLFFVVSILLQITNIAHLPAQLTLFQGLLIAYAPFILMTALRHNKDDNRMLRMISLGIMILVFFSVAELLRYNIQKYLNRDFLEGVNSLLPLGTLLFITMLIISYCVSMVDHMYVKAERELLLKMAYSDELTNIHNRAKCEEVLQELEYDKDGYAILNMDLNNLKQINDSLGHACGDRLLKDFAAILVKTFAADGTVGRMGGDEFIVILPRISKVRLQGRLEVMEEMMARQNVREKDIRLSVAWGYAFSTECAGGDTQAVYDLADQRMYKMKRSMKDSGLISDR